MGRRERRVGLRRTGEVGAKRTMEISMKLDLISMPRQRQSIHR